MPATKLQVIRQSGNNVILSRKCPFCRKEVRKEMDAKKFDDGMEALMNGALIQNAFPNVDADMRELIQTGICSKCWNEIFG